jgi:chemotaxis protein CheX
MMQIQVAGPVTYPRPATPGLIALVGITGEWNGSGAFCRSPMLASLVGSRMLGKDFDMLRPTVDEDVLDAVDEVTNMTFGSVKNILEQIAGPFAIGVPTVIYGRNFEFRSSSALKSTYVAFRADSGTLQNSRSRMGSHLRKFA